MYEPVIGTRAREPHSGFARLWQEAIDRYVHTTHRDLSQLSFREHTLMNCGTPDGVVEMLTDEDDALKEYRDEDSNWGKFRGMVSRIIDSVWQFAEPVANLANDVSPDNAFPFSWSLYPY
ncbi:hypothetical protein GYMLUDRAFT_47401 [Collybiopsis luxurians FD-317 M1]|uniref:Unplaced genomic scaffold GYMLUscaffold_52, whole genome shotgun sequence n=1 Tax=Collybiopsis luxurians FD-317 M1 TaxID=944289 RepID=A0A0D0C1G1_9AGAR|nr:hypothetical protein GYMLUDRAFT_47401 [Collybiopsis luxurians FD-317 M1]